MGEDTRHEEEPSLASDELDEQSAELLPDREAMSVIDGPLRGPMPLAEPISE